MYVRTQKPASIEVPVIARSFKMSITINMMLSRAIMNEVRYALGLISFFCLFLDQFAGSSPSGEMYSNLVMI